jgi:probable phosphoglycerate mutase
MVNASLMKNSASFPRVYLIRHGQTEWSLSGQHTGTTDIPLTAHGVEEAAHLQTRLAGITFAHVLTSPRLRARRTCELAGLGASARIEEELREWEYGEYEGLTSAQIQARQPGWNAYVDGFPDGETPDAVLARASRLAQRLRSLEGNVAVFSHGHFLRILTVAWIGFPITAVPRFSLATASVGILSHEHNRADRPVISLWNETRVAPSKA